MPTPSGKVEFYSATLAAQGQDPVPGFTPPSESRWSEGAKRFPLEFLSRKADNYMNSTFANLDGHRKMEARTSQRLEMHPTDAKARGIADGDKVRVWNDRGEIVLTALVDQHIFAIQRLRRSFLCRFFLSHLVLSWPQRKSSFTMDGALGADKFHLRLRTNCFYYDVASFMGARSLSS